MANNPAPLTEQQLAEFFPLIRQPLGANVFELGLVLGGTVSAGAYTAGVLDFLMEALDVWTRAKERGDPSAPMHDVVISTIGGASGGAINGAILTRAAGWSFPRGPDAGNPFYSSWTSGVDLMALLSTKPEPGVTGLASVFNCAAIDEQAERSIRFSGGALGEGDTPTRRSWLADPLRLIMTVGNVTGLPYRVRMHGESQLSYDLMGHQDAIRFALTVPGGMANPPGSRPDELALASRDTANWDMLRAASLATSAFPLAFRSRPLHRPLDACGYHATLIPGESGGDAQVAQLIPRWDTLTAGEADPNLVHFVNVDGGTMDNQPLDMVRTALAGMNGRNSRRGDKADRAVILIDPFSDPLALGPRQPPGLLALALPFVQSLVYQARFQPEDIALATAEEIYSRFLIAPVGPPGADGRTIGARAIAAGGLGGFLGFIDRRFMAYDYRLGRRNAYDFLARHFIFPEHNPIFVGPHWTDRQRQEQRVIDTNGVRHLRMIPLMPQLPVPPMPTASDWPRLPAMPAGLGAAIEARLNFAFEQIVDMVRPQVKSPLVRAALGGYARAGWYFARPTLRDKALKLISDALKQRGLL